jgi:hypothetical protein
MAEKINYGPSAAKLAEASAAAYEQGSAATLADINRQIAEESARMEAGVVAGMSPEETASMNARVNALKERAANVIASSQGAYQFAQQQAQSSADLYTRQMEELQTAQRNLAAQALGQARTNLSPVDAGRFTSEGLRSIAENAASVMATVGGERGLPAGSLVPTAGLVETGGAGLTGIQGQQNLLFGRALTAGQARAFSELQAQQMALATQIETQARESSAEREQRERQRVSDFRSSMFQYATQLAAQIGNNLNELKAKAAGADTRSGKKVAQAELDAYEKKSAINWKFTLKQIQAQARGQGLSKEETAMLEFDANQQRGNNEPLGKLLSGGLLNIPNLTTDTITGRILNADGKPLSLPGDRGQWFLDAGVLLYDPDGTGKKTAVNPQVDQLVMRVNAKIGQIMTLPKKQRGAAWDAFWNDSTTGLYNQTARKALAVVLGTPDALNSKWYKERLLNGIPSPYAGMGYKELRDVYNRMITTESLPRFGGSDTMAPPQPSPRPGPSPQPRR